MGRDNADPALVDARSGVEEECRTSEGIQETTRAGSTQLEQLAEIDAAAALHITAGRQPVLLKKGSKAPVRKNWQTVEYKSLEDWTGERRADGNIGLRLGTASGGIVDIDFDDPRMLDAFDQAAHSNGVSSETTTFGHHDRVTHRMYRALNMPADAKTVVLKEQGKTCIEMRCQPEQHTMIPPSLWTAKSDDERQPERLQFIGRDFSQLQEVEFALLERVVREAHAAVCKPQSASKSEGKKKKTELPPPTLALLQDVMGHISNAALDYNEWATIGLALKNSCGDDKPVSDGQGLELWIGFSANWPENPDDEAATRKKWKELRPNGKLNFGTLIHYAKKGGWVWIDDDIIRLNETHAVLPIGGKTRVVSFGESEEFPGVKGIVMAQTFYDFASLQEKYRHKTPEGEDVPLGKYWLNSPRRRQYDDGMEFMPHRDGDTSRKLNMWRGFGVKPIKPEGKSGAAGCAKFLDFARDVICDGDEEHFEYLMNREAFIVQQRRRSEIALALRSREEGVGKGFYEKHMRHLLGSHAMPINKPEHIIGKFNPHLETLLRLTADEALFVGNHEHRNTLFVLITEPKLTIEPKGCGVYTANNFLNISITSNAEHFIPASSTARRFFALTPSARRQQDREYFRKIEDQLANEGGHEALLYHLLHERELRDFDVVVVPKTAALAEQMAYGRRGVDGLVEKVCHEATVPCAHPYWPGFTITTRESGDEHEDFYGYIDRSKDRSLQIMGGLSVIARLRREWACTTDRKREKGSNQRVRGLHWPPLNELRERFVARFGPQEWTAADITEWPAGPTKY